MAVKSSTSSPNFDAELLKLRRKIGDINCKDDGELFVLDSTPESNLGEDGYAITSAELIDIWNYAAKELLKNIVGRTPQTRWSEYFPGYIISLREISSVSLAGDEYQADIIPLNSLHATYQPYRIIDIMAGNSTQYYGQEGKNLGKYIPPEMFFKVLNNFNSIYRAQVIYTIMTVMAEGELKSSILILPKSDTVGLYDITFLRRHLYQTRNSDINVDGSGMPVEIISDNSLELINILAEREYMNRRQFESTQINQNVINENLSIL
jgi:hypothetical protein